MIRAFVTALALAIAAFGTTQSAAHKPSDSYLSLRIEESTLSGQWDIALRDLELALSLDRNADGVIDWGEVRTRHAEIAAYALAHLTLRRGDSPCSLRATEHLIDEHSDGRYAVIRLAGECPGNAETVTLDYRLLFDLDAQHRGLLKLESSGVRAAVQTAVFASESREQTLALDPHQISLGFLTYVADGVKHIAIGVDHILFLIALLLPAVLIRRDGLWAPVSRLGDALWNVFQIVTAFTLAHSLTLSLAALDIVRLPSRWVESAIAVSVLLTAIDNLRPFLPQKRWTIAFAFGLIHGFGFANVLSDLSLPAESLLSALLGFNLGVEIGQLILVMLLVPLAYLSRERRNYSRLALGAGSLAIAAISLGWFVERSFNLQLMPF